ncbi:hypothetical protein HHI36_019485 [Cryptolaemus montrouzieri]|uniref:Uncharacterized protein n=1 Tax=Cryptolaemus montrouzieri TaxID=559131 RepID=A0ABD2P324_9CUCU
MLLEYGANANLKDIDGNTPLLIAVKHSKRDIAFALIDHNVDVTIADNNRSTPLHHAVAHNWVDMVKLLLKRGANINATEKGGISALHLVSSNPAYVQCLNTLLKHNANPNLRDIFGNTPLHQVCQLIYEENVRAILDHGGNPNAGNNKGEVPLHRALEVGHKKTIITLLEYGTDVNTRTPEGTLIEKAIQCVNRSMGIEQTRAHRYEIVLLIARFIIVRQVMNLYVHPDCLPSLNYNDLKDQFDQIRKQCEEEYEKIKINKVGDSDVTYYTLMTAPTRTLLLYSRNPSIYEIMRKEIYMKRYPMFGNMIRSNFRVALQKREMYLKAFKIFNSIFGGLPKLPCICIDLISSFFTEKEIKALVESFEYA